MPLTLPPPARVPASAMSKAAGRSVEDVVNRRAGFRKRLRRLAQDRALGRLAERVFHGLRAWHPGHALPLLAAAAIGVLLSLAGAEFKARARNHANVLQTGINSQLDRLAILRNLFDATEDGVTRGEFETFARRLLQGHPAIHNLAWAPRVAGPDRVAHELAGARAGLDGYRVSEPTGPGRLRPAPERDEYFPRFYVSAASGPAMYGLDLGWEPSRRGTLERARDTNEMSASPLFELHSAQHDRRGLYAIIPVYRRGAPIATRDERRRNLAGFVQGTFQIKTMVDAILAGLRTPVDVYLFASDATPDALPIYAHPSPLRPPPVEAKSLAILQEGRHWRREITVADRTWIVVITPMPGAPSAPQDRAGMVLVAGLLVSGVLILYLRAVGSYAVRLETANRKIALLAEKDDLTGLANRRVFNERLAMEFAAARRGAGRFAVLLVDLDHFKDINDTLGHPVGDQVIREAAKRLGNSVRQVDLVARLGGDEFAILQSGIADASDAGNLAARIEKSLSAPCEIDGNTLTLTASIGIALRGAPDLGPEALMMQADLALYRAKDDGRSCYRFHSAELDARVHERVIVADQLREALERDEMELFYQPQIELSSGRVIGLEALVRWNHPERGIVMPDAFISVAEKSGSIHVLGEWVIDQACRQLRIWQDQGIAPPLLAVNVSAQQFKRSSDLEQAVTNSLTRWAVSPCQLELELTESVLMEARAEHREALERLGALGVRIALDDFGTGYSSLEYLAAYPVTRLKIAQQLVSPVICSPRNAAVVRAAITLAHLLRIEVIAEGVESEAHAATLRSYGCDQAQGYHLGRPAATTETTLLLRSGKLEFAAA